jgi:aminoglycoside phosphotransferase (APT) family kinase protein
MCAAAGELTPPTEGALVLADIFPPQFLHEDGRVVAMIDIDAYVVGPRELDFVCLEYFVDEHSAALIARGYREVSQLPAIEPVRRVYRYFFWLLTMNPMALDYDRWTTWPAAFE